MEYTTIIVSVAIALPALLLSFIAKPIKRMMTRDVKIVFNTGETFTLPVKGDTPEYEVAQKINDVVDKVLFQKRLVDSINSKISDEKTRVLDEHISKYILLEDMTNEYPFSRKNIVKDVGAECPSGK